MTVEKLHNLIFQANQNCGPDEIFARPIHPFVDLAIIYCSGSYSTGTEIINGYFIYTQPGEVGGIVVDHGSDLHIYMLHKYRGQGIMKRALRDVILPHLGTLRNEQFVSVTEGESSEYTGKIFESIGFHQVGDDNIRRTLKMSLKKYLRFRPSEFPMSLDREGFLKLKRDLIETSIKFRKLLSALEMGVSGDISPEDISELELTNKGISTNSLSIFDDAFYAREKRENDSHLDSRWDRGILGFKIQAEQERNSIREEE